MAAIPRTAPLIWLPCLCLLMLTAGCTGTGFGEVDYADGALQVEVDNPSGPLEATLQVTISRTSTFEQEEVETIVRTIQVQEGTNTFSYPVILEPGSYKIYLHLLKGDERTAAVIKDIQV